MEKPTTEKETPPAFAGFPTPTKNFFSMPNAITDIIAEITNMSELKVIIYVIRHTWGFHEFGKPKAISVDEFMNGRRHANGKTRMDTGTGLSHHSVIDGLKKAVEHGYLICEVDDSDMARVKKSYALKMMEPTEETTPGEEFAPPEEFAPGAESTPQQCNNCTTGVKNLHRSSAESSDRSEKYTLRNTPKKNTQEKQDTMARESNTNDSGSALATPTHAPSTHAQSEDAASIVREVEQDSPDHDRTDNEKGNTNAHASGNNAARPGAAHAADSRVAQDVAAAECVAGSVATEMASQLPTSDVDKSANGGKVTPDKGAGKGKGRGNTASSQVEPPTLSPNAEKVWQAWCSIFTVDVKLIPANAKAAEELVNPARVWCGKLHWTLAEWLKDVKDKAYAADAKGYYKTRGVKLFDIPRELEGWQSAKEHELATLARSTASNAATAPTASGLPRWVTPDVAFARAASGD